ncbi:hypothetical protein C823_005958 [Eubacterium plexicaudatum ASF492]|nr:hypothetical protein C823_005958 [Eubacterium plexicaudatum ASF492]
MTSSPEEIREGAEEGVILHAAHTFLRITGETKATGVELKKVNRFYFDENRKAVLETEEGSNRIIEVDNVIFAVGQKPDGTENMSLELTHGPYIATTESATSMEGVFAAGDVVTGTASVIEAIAGGRKAAMEIDRYLGGNGDITEVLVEREAPDPHIGRVEGFAELQRVNPKMPEAEVRVKGFAELQRVNPKMPEAEVRVKGFAAIENPFTCEEAKCEAGRCLQCDLRTTITKPKLWNEY